ncbi:MAG: glycosyltransferase family 39 protein [Robiginitomaculum sp.]|nr:glycosyltransferase family 39 protein [Robiginitomaculum sp.]MDQ7076654.1 glycosyltransferase family 39 protein [Robiginitomaculum sp.]
MQNVFSGRHALLIAVVSVVASLAGVFTMPVLDVDEARFAQASAQMAQSGDYLHIRFLDAPRNAKPAGIYWMQAASARLFGQLETRQIWAWRLPSVLGALLAALAMYWGGCALVGERAAFWGSLLLAPSLLLASEGGIAKTDAMLVGMTTLAMAALAHLRHGDDRRLALVFWPALAGGILIKGPITPLIAALVLLVLWRWEGQTRWMRPLRHWPGLVLAALMVGPWLILMQSGTDGGFIKEAVGGDLLPKLWRAQETHGGLPGVYVVSLILMLFPASIFVPAGIARLWTARHDVGASGPDWHFLLAWVLPWWVLIELIPTKLVHYPLPVYPALALVAGLGVEHLAKTRRISWAGVVLTMAAPAAVIVLYGLLLRTTGLGEIRWENFISFSVLSLGAVGFLIDKKAYKAATLAVLTALSLHLQMRAKSLPALQALFPAQTLTELLAENGQLPKGLVNQPAIAATGIALPSLVFQSGGQVWFATPEAAAQAFAKGQVVLVEERQRSRFDAARDGTEQDVVTLGVVEGYNYTKGQSARVYVLSPKRKPSYHEPPD